MRNTSPTGQFVDQKTLVYSQPSTKAGMRKMSRKDARMTTLKMMNRSRNFMVARPDYTKYARPIKVFLPQAYMV
jgi:hypothetical protein